MLYPIIVPVLFKQQDQSHNKGDPRRFFNKNQEVDFPDNRAFPQGLRAKHAEAAKDTAGHDAVYGNGDD